ncbi:hypothetical protein COOONC_21303 [Cooperia oncophora]
MLYVAFFIIEINFVDKVLKRRKFITEKSGSHGKESADGDSERVYDEEVDDRILNLDVAKTVVEQALAAVPATEASGMLMEMWKECNKVEVPNIEKIRSLIVDKLKEFDNEDTRLFEIELAARSGKSKFELYEEALRKTSTERMHRLYMQWQKDAFVESKIREVYRGLCEGGWMNDKDWTEMERIMHDFPDEFDAEFITKCLEKSPKSAAIWDVYLEKCVDESSMSSDDFRALCSRALEKVDPDESYPIWQHAIDLQHHARPQRDRTDFPRCAEVCERQRVASKIKILFMEYLNELFDEGKLSAERLRERIMELINSKPNRSDFYCALYRKEMERPNPDSKFAGFAHQERQSWKRMTGLKLFEGPELDEFLVRWTQLLQDAATDVEEKNDGSKKNGASQESGPETVNEEDATVVKKEMECRCECENLRDAKKMKRRKRKAE